MRSMSPTAGEAAINHAITSDSDKSPAVASDTDDWFGSMVREILGKDAGLHLHYATGAPEGSCYKYVTKEALSRRQPPAFVLRQLLRSKQGRPFLDALMDGCEEQWWLDYKRAAEVGSKVLEITKG